MLTRYTAWANELIFAATAKLPPGAAEKPRPGLFKNMQHMLNHNYVIDDIFKCHLEGKPHAYTARARHTLRWQCPLECARAPRRSLPDPRAYMHFTSRSSTCPSPPTS